MKKVVVSDPERESSLKEFCDNMAETAADLEDDETFDLVIHQLIRFYREQSEQEKKSCEDSRFCR